MAINTLAAATLFQKTLDEAAVREATTGWMEANAGQVIYNGGSRGQDPKDGRYREWPTTIEIRATHRAASHLNMRPEK